MPKPIEQAKKEADLEIVLNERNFPGLKQMEKVFHVIKNPENKIINVSSQPQTGKTGFIISCAYKFSALGYQSLILLSQLLVAIILPSGENLTPVTGA